MADVIVVGGGPAGLSAALFTAKNGLDTRVFDTDETLVHEAHLFNYLGIESIDGDEFLDVARGQVEDRGATFEDVEVTRVDEIDDGFRVHTADEEYESTYVVLATGQSRDLADSLGCDFDDDGTIVVDQDCESTEEGAYAVGWAARKDKIQVAISVGMGASAGIDILSEETGEAFHDFDTPADAQSD